MMRVVFGAIAIVLVTMPSSAGAQQPAAIRDAARLRDAREFAAAAHALDAYLDSNPSDAGTHWLQAQLLYWAGNNNAAQRAYERALRLTPADTNLRIDYARFLVATGRISRARSVIDGLPNESGAAHELQQQILHATSQWTRLEISRSTDNQSLRTAVANVEAGFYATPSLALSLSGTLQRYDADSVASGVNNAGAITAAASLSPGGSRFAARAAAGLERTTEASHSRRPNAAREAVVAPIGSLMLAVHAVAGTTLRATWDRHIYHHTLASIDTAFGVGAIEIALDRSGASGVAALLALRSESYPGANTVRTAYAWVLAPVMRGVRLGASGAWQDADESRWNGQRYAPYYTPENVRTASLLAELKFAGAARSFQINGSYGVFAREDAPVGGQQGTSFLERTFTPWSVAGTGTIRISPRASLTFRGEHQATAFYDATQGAVALLWHAH